MKLASQDYSSFIILGGGQHAYLVNGLAIKQGLKIYGWLDRSETSKFQASDKFVQISNDADYKDLAANGVGIIPGMASLELWSKRTTLLMDLSDPSKLNPIIMDARSQVSDSVQLGDGIQFIGNCFIQSDTQIGNWSIINSGSIVEHDTFIGDYVHIAPGVTVCGGVSIGRGSYIGAGSTIIEGVSIGENVIIGAGSLVLKDVSDGEFQYGAPSVNRGTRNG